MDRVFTIEQLRPIKNGMTISRDAKMGTTTGITFFSLGKDTSISQECYEQHHQSRIRNCIRRYTLRSKFYNKHRHDNSTTVKAKLLHRKWKACVDHRF